MRDITAESITDAVAQAWGNAPDPRVRQLLQKLTQHLHAFVRDVQPTHDEWLATVDFLWRCGRISNEQRNEFALLSDVFGITSLVDLQNAAPGATIGSVLGPFYSADSPQVQLGADLTKDNDGDAVLLTGIVRSVEGKPLPGAVVDMWQTNTKGIYATQDTAQADDNLRCKQVCGPDGRYGFTTVEPAPYTIPMDGPVADVVRLAKRTPWRPAHYHFIVTAAGHRPIVTEIFFAHDHRVENDAVFGARQALIRPIEPVAPGTVLPLSTDRQPDRRLDFDFTLVPAT